MVASVSPSPTVYVSPAAAGDGLGDGLGGGDGDGAIVGGFATGDGLAGAAAGADVGVGVAPPTHPQAASRVVPTISEWTSQRGFGIASILDMVLQRYALDGSGATDFGVTDAES